MEKTHEKSECASSRTLAHLHWEISDWCNYACSYCTEGRYAPYKPKVRFAPESVVCSVLDFLGTLKDFWTVRLCSGEPSTHPRLFDLVRGITRAGHRVAMETNLSLPIDRYLGFIEAAGTRLHYLHVSLHLDHVEPGEFLEKCAVLAKKIRTVPGAGIYPATVVVPDRTDKIAEAVRMFSERGLHLNLQRLRSARAAGCSEKLAAGLQSHLEERTSGSGSSQGKDCWAGTRWMLVDLRGEAWRCHAGRGDARSRIGRLDGGGAELAVGPRPCSYVRCDCPGRPVPADPIA